MKLINSETLAESYCKKMCAGKCSGKEKEKCKFMQLLNEQPTAFDVEKVVERLEEYRDDFMDDIYEELRDDPDNCRANRIIDRFDETIEIVRKGGIE